MVNIEMILRSVLILSAMMVFGVLLVKYALTKLKPLLVWSMLMLMIGLAEGAATPAKSYSPLTFTTPVELGEKLVVVFGAASSSILLAGAILIAWEELKYMIAPLVLGVLTVAFRLAGYPAGSAVISILTLAPAVAIFWYSYLKFKSLKAFLFGISSLTLVLGYVLRSYNLTVGLILSIIGVLTMAAAIFSKAT